MITSYGFSVDINSFLTKNCVIFPYLSKKYILSYKSWLITDQFLNFFFYVQIKK